MISCWHGSVLVLTLDLEVCAIAISVCLFVAYLLQLFVPDQAYLGILTSVSHSHKLDADMENAEAALESIQYIVHLCAHLVHTLSIVVDFKVGVRSGILERYPICEWWFSPPYEALLTKTHIATYSVSALCEWEVDLVCNIDYSPLKWRFRHNPSQ